MTPPPSSDAGLAPPPVIPVSLLNRLAREKLESAFPLCWIAGEISNLTYAASGHVYFSLKDASAQVRCVMFRNRAQLLGWRLTNGQHIEARALVTLYEARGDFQLNIEAARKAGVGNLYEQFLRLKAKLEAEGLFAPESKRPLPPFPRRIGIITSPQAAALRDVLTTFARRAPQLNLILYPTPVQGEGAAAQIAAALTTAGRRAECDALILCRGGGSLEDLWAFNDEGLARAIRACPLPVVTGVGHDTDTTIADFAADLRAPTPTAAAEIVAPERAALLRGLAERATALQRQMQRGLEQRAQSLDALARRLVHPADTLARQREGLDALQHRLTAALALACARRRQRVTELALHLKQNLPTTALLRQRTGHLASLMHNAWQRQDGAYANQLERLASGLAHLNPDAVLARGFSIVFNAQGEILRDSRALEPNERITVSFSAGRAEAVVHTLTHETPILKS